jgi:carbamoyl-phosphate synthase large subunit
MQDALTILFTSAGRRNQLMSCFRNDAAYMGLELRVLAADAQPQLSPASHQADTSFEVPRCTSSEYIPALRQICERENVRLIVPTIDTELAVLSRERRAFEQAGTRVLVSSPEIVALAGDKYTTSTQLAAYGIPTPLTLRLDEYRRDPTRLTGPVIAKPNGGSASIGIVRPGSPRDLDSLDAQTYIVQELWKGSEYTVNIFFDSDGTLRCAVPHRRIEVRAGEVSKGRTERLTALTDAAHKLGSQLRGARGPLCFQAVVRNDGACAIFEINARFGGGFPLAHFAGARMSQWILEELTGRPSTANDDWRAGATMLRYDAAVFFDA